MDIDDGSSDLDSDDEAYKKQQLRRKQRRVDYHNRPGARKKAAELRKAMAQAKVDERKALQEAAEQKALQESVVMTKIAQRKALQEAAKCPPPADTRSLAALNIDPVRAMPKAMPIRPPPPVKSLPVKAAGVVKPYDRAPPPPPQGKVPVLQQTGKAPVKLNRFNNPYGKYSPA